MGSSSDRWNSGLLLVQQRCNGLWQQFGALYNQFAIETGNLCPAGWHVPTFDEWNELIDNVGGADIAGKELKTTNGWYNEGNGSDRYGFSALPGGYRLKGATFQDNALAGMWWTATEYYIYMMSYQSDGAMGGPMSDEGSFDESMKTMGLSVRCVKN